MLTWTVKLVKDDKTKRSRGFAFIQFTSQDDAMLALENMDHQVFLYSHPLALKYLEFLNIGKLIVLFDQNLDGRVIYIEIAKPGILAFGGYPRTSGPPSHQHLLVQEEVSDCWY